VRPAARTAVAAKFVHGRSHYVVAMAGSARSVPYLLTLMDEVVKAPTEDYLMGWWLWRRCVGQERLHYIQHEAPKSKHPSLLTKLVLMFQATLGWLNSPSPVASTRSIEISCCRVPIGFLVFSFLAVQQLCAFFSRVRTSRCCCAWSTIHVVFALPLARLQRIL
jgi:hypothetical protein